MCIPGRFCVGSGVMIGSRLCCRADGGVWSAAGGEGGVHTPRLSYRTPVLGSACFVGSYYKSNCLQQGLWLFVGFLGLGPVLGSSRLIQLPPTGFSCIFSTVRFVGALTRARGLHNAVYKRRVEQEL